MLDVFSRQGIGWSMQSRMDRGLALNALLMAIWMRNPTGPVIVHSDVNLIKMSMRSIACVMGSKQRILGWQTGGRRCAARHFQPEN